MIRLYNVAYCIFHAIWQVVKNIFCSIAIAICLCIEMMVAESPQDGSGSTLREGRVLVLAENNN